MEPELPSRFLGVGYDQVECLDIQELISGHCIVLDGEISTVKLLLLVLNVCCGRRDPLFYLGWFETRLGVGDLYLGLRRNHCERGPWA
jgi:hypothetical protein